MEFLGLLIGFILLMILLAIMIPIVTFFAIIPIATGLLAAVAGLQTADNIFYGAGLGERIKSKILNLHKRVNDRLVKYAVDLTTDPDAPRTPTPARPPAEPEIDPEILDAEIEEDLAELDNEHEHV